MRLAATQPAPRPGLRVEVLDVGQGDAILLQPARAAPSGRRRSAGRRPGAQARRRRGRRLGAAVVTHDQSDHAGGIEELVGALPVRRLLFAPPGRL